MHSKFGSKYFGKTPEDFHHTDANEDKKWDGKGQPGAIDKILNVWREKMGLTTTISRGDSNWFNRNYLNDTKVWFFGQSVFTYGYKGKTMRIEQYQSSSLFELEVKNDKIFQHFNKTIKSKLPEVKD